MPLKSVRAKPVLIIFAIGLVTAVGFQNCGQSGVGSGTEDGGSNSTLDSKLTNLPFPYDISVNQIAYLSCPSSGVATNGKFTFMMGAFDNGIDKPSSSLGISTAGIKLRANFLTEFDKATATYPADVRTKKMTEALAGIPAALHAQPQLSIRDTQKGLRFNVYARGTTGANQVTNLMAPMSNAEFAEAFSKNRSLTYNYFPAVTEYRERSLDGPLNLPVNSGADEQLFRTEISNNLLVASFVDSSVEINGGIGNQPFSAKAGSQNAIYGRGYQMTFARPARNLNLSSYPARALTSISEYDLSTDPKSAVSVSWDCTRQFKVVRMEDRYNFIIGANGVTNKYACPAETFTQQSSAANMATLHVLRRFLPATAWDINVTEKCIVPKTGGCYDYTTDKIIYDETFYPNPVAGQSARCGDSLSYDCAHYLTVCIRK